MKPIPTDWQGKQARVFNALCQGIAEGDPFARLEALRAVSISSRDGSAAEKAAPDKSNADR